MSGSNLRKQHRLASDLLVASFSSTTHWICAPCRARLAGTRVRKVSSAQCAVRSASTLSGSAQREGSESESERQDALVGSSAREIPDQLRKEEAFQPGSSKRWDRTRDVYALDQGQEVVRRRNNGERRIESVETLQYLSSLSSQSQRLSQRTSFAGGSPDHGATSDSQDVGSAISTIADPYDALMRAVRARDVSVIASLLEESRQDRTFLVGIPKTTWTQILRSFDSRNFLPPLHGFHRSFNRSRLLQVGYNAKLAQREFMRHIVSVVRLRREHAIHMSTSDYRILLQHCARMGNAEMAKALYSDLQMEKLESDILCYNAVMQAIVYDEESLLEMKSRTRKSAKWKTEGAADIVTFKPGASPAIREIFAEMQKNRVVPNMESYCTFLITLGRDGYFEEVELILKDVFRIDVQAIMEGEEASIRPLETDATVYPDQNLLNTIADVFGPMNRLPTALRILDHLSKTYNLDISQSVWYKVCKWTWMQASLPATDRLQPGSKSPSLDDVTAVGDLMVSEPYKAHPNIDTLDILFRSSWTGSSSHDASPLARRFAILEAGRDEYIRLIDQYRTLSQQLQNASAPRREPPPASLATLHLATSNALLKKRRVQITLQRWCRRLLLPKGVDFRPAAPTAEWTARGLPDFILHWRAFMPHVVKYRVASGTVELAFRTAAEQEAQRERKGIADRRAGKFRWEEDEVVDREVLGEERRRGGFDFRENAGVAGWRDGEAGL